MANVNGTEIDLMPTDGMRTEAQRYRDWKADGEPGGTDVAATRAGQILSGDELSPETVITMAAWFARHEVDKQGQGFSPGEDGYPSPGRVAWAAWGGDPGKTWADAKASRIKALQERSIEARPYPNEHAARLIDPAEFERFRRNNGAGGAGIDFIYGIKGAEPVRLQAIRFDASRFTPADARRWLTDHDHRPILFEEATGNRSILNATITAPMELRDIQQEQLRRSDAVEFSRAGEAEESRAFQFSFSSETPVERWFGTEVLSHDASGPDLTRLNDGAPLLWNHDPNQVLGVVERGWVDSDKRRGMANVRFSRSAFAEEKLRDIRDGILRNVSFGYKILETQAGANGAVVATRWQPLEVSVVSVPADAGVGIGRSLTPSTAAPAASPAPQPMEEQTIDLAAVRAAAAAEERTRVASITGLCRQHNTDDLAQGLIERGASEADAMRDILGAISTRTVQHATAATPAVRPISSNAADIGLSEREARSFSFLRAIRAQASPNDRQAWEAAAFEREVSDATATRMGIARDGIHIPHDVLRRDLTVGTGTAAGDLVFTDARPGSFIELLRNRLALTTLGVQTLTGLTGPVAIPKQTGAATAYWVAEKGTTTESNPTVGQINMTPKTCGAYTEFSRRLLIQSSIDIETMVRNELTQILALEVDRVALYGTGSASQPLGLKNITGINTKDFNANQPTYAELVELETLIAADNADIGAMAYLTNATIYGGMKTTEKASGTAQFVLEPGGTVGGYPIVRSNQVESNDVWFGVWSQMIMGMFGALTLQVNPYALDTSGGVRVTAFQDVDIAVRHAEAFARGNNTL